MTKGKTEIKRTLGLDAHPDSFTAAIVVGRIPHEAVVEKVSDAIELEEMERWFERYVDRDTTVVLEASGNSFAIYERLCAVGYHVLVLDSEQVGKIGKSYCNTDKISAVRLARAFLTGLSDNVWVPDPVTRQRREVFGTYMQATKDSTRNSNRIKSMLNEYTIRMKKGLKTLSNPKAKEFVFSAREWTEAQRVLLDESFSDLERSKEKQARLRKMMSREVLHDPLMLQLLRIFGISKINAYGLIAMIGDPHRFSSPKKMSAYFGLNPKVKESGKTKKLGGISKKGRKDMRSLLIQAAHVVLRHNSKGNPLYNWGWKMNYRKGRNVAAVAIARKISVAIWYMLMGKPFKARERTATLTRKLQNLAKELGVKEIKSMGFKTYNHFAEHKLQQLGEFT